VFELTVTPTAVTSRYSGAKTRQRVENRCAWKTAIDRTSGSGVAVALRAGWLDTVG
jgi:hypothetical protein